MTHRLRAGAAGLALLLAAPTWAAPANDIVEEYSMSSLVSFLRPDFSFTQFSRTAAEPPYAQQFTTPGTPVVLNLDLTTTLGPNGSFLFLHNLYALGGGQASMETTLDIKLTNTGAETAFLRFDSLITPGHIAFQGASIFHAVEFGFRVEQFATGAVDFNTPVLAQLYSARGSLTSSSARASSIRTSDNQPFNNFTEYRSPGRVAFDWTSTPLNLELLPIAAGATHTIRYTNSTSVTANGGVCLTELGCEGVQVAFGDPRNDGSSGTFSASAFAMSAAGDQPLIGRRFTALEGALAQVVEQGAPLPVIDTPPIVVNYAWLPPVNGSTGAIPEPASWLMLITGFGCTGAAARRRRRAMV